MDESCHTWYSNSVTSQIYWIVAPVINTVEAWLLSLHSSSHRKQKAKWVWMSWVATRWVVSPRDLCRNVTHRAFFWRFVRSLCRYTRWEVSRRNSLSFLLTPRAVFMSLHKMSFVARCVVSQRVMCRDVTHRAFFWCIVLSLCRYTRWDVSRRNSLSFLLTPRAVFMSLHKMSFVATRVVSQRVMCRDVTHRAFFWCIVLSLCRYTRWVVSQHDLCHDVTYLQGGEDP